MPPEQTSGRAAVLLAGPPSRALIRELGTTAWTVLLDVIVDAGPEDAGWAARTSVRVIADHLGLAPGTVARALGRLHAAGLVRRHDRRDRVTGRFVESVYVVVATVAIQPCVDCPHTVEPNTAGWHPADTDARDRAAGQRLPEGMASVCRSLSSGGRKAGSGAGSAQEAGAGREEGRGSEDGRGGEVEGRQTGDRQGVAGFGRGAGSC
jgi:DNA-binding MarR family transcriptional regulator